MSSDLPTGASIEVISALPGYSPPLHEGTVNRRLVPADAGAGFEMIHGTLAPSGGADAHFHASEWQVILVQSGSGRIRLGDGPFHDVGPGTVIRIPPGVAHAFEVTSQTPAQVYVIYAPPLGPNGFHKA